MLEKNAVDSAIHFAKKTISGLMVFTETTLQRESKIDPDLDTDGFAGHIPNRKYLQYSAGLIISENFTLKLNSKHCFRKGNFFTIPSHCSSIKSHSHGLTDQKRKTF